MNHNKKYIVKYHEDLAYVINSEHIVCVKFEKYNIFIKTSDGKTIHADEDTVCENFKQDFIAPKNNFD
jgi:hypothetical protein